MKSIMIIALAVGISVVSVFIISEIIWYFTNQEFEKAKDELKESLANTFKKQYGVIPTPALKIKCSGNAKCITGEITQIIDGDTIKVDGQSIRFALASAPELNELGGNVAKEFIEEMCPVGSKVLVDEDDGQIQGSYGRILGIVYCNKLNLNEELVNSEFGYLSSGFCKTSEFAGDEWARKHGC